MNSVSAQVEEEQEEERTDIDKNLSFIPLPIIAANPTMGLVYGFAPGATWKNGDPNTTTMSNFIGSFLYTTNDQLLLQIRGSTFLKDDSWFLSTDIRYNKNSQPTYGLGTKPSITTTAADNNAEVSDNLYEGPPKQEMLKFDHIRLSQTFLKKHKTSRFFYGVGYHLDSMSNIDDQLEEKIVDDGNDTFHEIHQKENGLPTDAYTQSGLSLNLSFDSRDNSANPFSGRLASASYRINNELLGSTADSTQLWLEYRDYFPLSPTRERNILAFWTYGWFVTSGDVPYMFLPATGWDMFGRSARPFTTGRFRGEDLSYTELEWRFPLQKDSDQLGGVLFSNMTSASNPEESVFLFDYFQLGYGLGLRYLLDKESRVNISLDYGRGFHDASGFFLYLNETF